MEDIRVTLLALVGLLVALTIIVGSAIFAPSVLVLLATLGAWTNLTYLIGVTLMR